MKAFTLIETLVYLALCSLILGGIFTSLESIRVSSNSNESQALLMQESFFLSDKLFYEVDRSEGVIEPASHSTAELLRLQNDQETTIHSINRVVRLSRGAKEFPLTAEDIEISTLSFVRIGTTGSSTDPEYLDIAFTLRTRAASGKRYEQSTTRRIYLP